VIPKYKPYLDFSEIKSLFNFDKNIIQKFEEDFARTVHSKYALSFPYGRSGLFALLKSQGIQKAEILVPAYTCIVVPNAIVASGNIPKFVDISLDDYNIGLKDVSSSLSEGTRAIIPTHMYGYPMNVRQLRETIDDNRILVIEDACLALSSKDVGKYGDAAFYSFNIGKQIVTFDGSIVTTNNGDIYEKLKSYREANFKETSIKTEFRKIVMLLASRFIFNRTAYGLTYVIWKRSKTLRKRTRNWDVANTSMPKDYLESYSKVQAKIGIAQLQKVKEIIERRKKIAKLYNEQLKDVKGITLPPIVEGATYSHYTIRIKNRDKLVKALEKRGVQAGCTFDYSIPHTSAYAKHAKEGNFNNSITAAEEIMNLPNYPSLSEREIKNICLVVWNLQSSDRS